MTGDIPGAGLAPAPLDASWASLLSSTVSDCLDGTGTMASAIRSLTGHRLTARVWTARADAGSNTILEQAIATAPPGTALVVDAAGCAEHAVFGEVKAAAAMRRGIAGLVLDGATRHLRQLTESGFPVFARGACPRGPRNPGAGEIGQTVRCGGVAVSPGDIVIADLDGVVIVPRHLERQVLADAIARHQQHLGRLAQARS